MHGTGYYWEPRPKADVTTEEYFLSFEQLCYYYHPDMKDSYEPDCDRLDKYKVHIYKWRTCKNGGLIADHLSSHVELSDLTKDEANKIWWNVRGGDFGFERLKGCIEQMANGRKLNIKE